MQTSTAGPSSVPPTWAAVIHGQKIQKAVMAILSLRTAPITTTSWADHFYRCTYHLSIGWLVLSVKESADIAAATAYFGMLRRKSGFTCFLTAARARGNLGFSSSAGAAVLLKNGKVLQVDAAGMPPVSGPNLISRTDLAYEIAIAVLACWRESPRDIPALNGPVAATGPTRLGVI